MDKQKRNPRPSDKTGFLFPLPEPEDKNRKALCEIKEPVVQKTSILDEEDKQRLDERSDDEPYWQK